MRIPSPGVHKAVNLKSPFMICRMAAHAEFLRLASHRSSNALMGPTCNRSKQSASVCSCDLQEVQFSGGSWWAFEAHEHDAGERYDCVYSVRIMPKGCLQLPTFLSYQPSFGNRVGLLGQLTLLLLSFSVNRFLSSGKNLLLFFKYRYFGTTTKTNSSLSSFGKKKKKKKKKKRAAHG